MSKLSHAKNSICQSVFPARYAPPLARAVEAMEMLASGLMFGRE